LSFRGGTVFTQRCLYNRHMTAPIGHSVNVALGERRYLVNIGVDFLQELILDERLRTASTVAFVTNTGIMQLYRPVVDKLCDLCPSLLVIEIPDGERFKEWRSLERIISTLLGAKCDRKALILAFGGGVVGDIAGFAAATYMRGIDFIQIPTTLLAQVDSSVGGKTAINHPLGKNMIGAFHQPRAVYADVSLLKTLPACELSAGIAEVIKHGLLADQDLFEWLEQNMPRLLVFDEDALIHVVKRSVEIKAAIVAEDETETGVRALLNLGHTFGHALEAVFGYGTWLHGEAVGCGLVLAAKMSQRLGMLDANEVERVQAVVASANLPVKVPRDAATPALIEAMLLDKKNEHGKLRFVLLESLGKAIIQTAPVELAARPAKLFRNICCACPLRM
jgi:shikimate kinase / 3-dehydroquinate synthase